MPPESTIACGPDNGSLRTRENPGFWGGPPPRRAGPGRIFSYSPRELPPGNPQNRGFWPNSQKRLFLGSVEEQKTTEYGGSPLYGYIPPKWGESQKSGKIRCPGVSRIGELLNTLRKCQFSGGPRSGDPPRIPRSQGIWGVYPLRIGVYTPP